MKNILKTTIMEFVEKEPKISVGIMEGQTEVFGRFNGNFYTSRFDVISGQFLAKANHGAVSLYDEVQREIIRSPFIRLTSPRNSSFSLFNIIIGSHFHWESREDQTFQGNLIFLLTKDQTICVINEIFLEDYLASVISSEMNPSSPMEFLKAHSILSRSWLLSILDRKKKVNRTSRQGEKITEKEIIRWYNQEDHDLFDVCADDHCQRYQGITRILSKQVEEAIRKTHGVVITYQDEICDARYSKACGGLTEIFETAWEDKEVPYLRCISDASVSHRQIQTEEEASAWILTEPEANCNIKDERILENILQSLDYKTKDFFRWKVEYSREELKEILQEKTGLDFGTIKEIIPLRRGPSGRISRLKIVGSKLSRVIGKELEIRRCLSRNHLYSSAFVVRIEGELFIFHGAGWGHGVGLCQIGAAFKAIQGFSTEEILKHYFRGIELKKIY